MSRWRRAKSPSASANADSGDAVSPTRLSPASPATSSVVAWQDLGQARSHQAYVTQCQCWQRSAADLRRHVKDYCRLVQQTSACLQSVAKSFSALLSATPLWQASVAFQQAAQTSEEATHKFRVQMKHDVLGTLRGFTALLPAVEESVGRHKQRADAVDSSQAHLEAVERRHSGSFSASPPTISFTGGGGGGGGGGDSGVQSSLRLNQERDEEEAMARLQAASVEFAEEDGKLATVWSALEETRKQLVGSALVSSMNCLGWRNSHNSELFSELGKFQDVKSLADSLVTMDPVKHASQQWMSVAMGNSSLRDKAALSSNDIQCITLCRNQDDMPEAMRENLSHRIDQLLENYMCEFNALPDTVTQVTAGFHLNPDAIEKALKNCCTDLEAKAAGFCGVEMTDPSALRPQMLLDLPRSQCTIGTMFFDCVPYNEATEAFDARMQSVEELIRTSEVTKVARAGKPRPTLRSEDRRQLAEFLLSHTCNTITNAAAKTAVQLVFGKAYLVLVKPSSDHRYQRASTVEVRKQQLTVSVPSMWWIVEDAPTFGPVRPCVDLTKPLGVVNANYTLSLDLSIGNLETWKQTLAVVEVTRCGTTQMTRSRSLYTGGADTSSASVAAHSSGILRNSLGSLKSAVRRVRSSGAGGGVGSAPGVISGAGGSGVTDASPTALSPLSSIAGKLP